MILEEFDGLCAYCDREATTWDHVVPIAEGGRTTPGNVVPACAPCNSSKGKRHVFAWLRETGRVVKVAFVERHIPYYAGLNG